MKVVLILYSITGNPVMDQYPDKASCETVADAVKKAWPDRYSAHLCIQFKK